ncbi:MAG: GspH/FimT family protein [Desulfovibrionaceae bacterium]|jgi:type IV fimbrial biogenesis protein FimT|nr:GspH/FimT family protein [Desulfovibrionaceae bacterium]
MEAIRRGGGVVLEKRPLTGDCAYAGRSGTQYWSCGWFIYADADGNGAFDDGDVLIQSFPAPRNLNAKWSVVQRRFVFDRWGNSNIGLGSVGFTIFPEPDGDTSPVTTTLCVASGGRINAVSRSKC